MLCLGTISDRPGHFDKLFRTCHEIAQLPFSNDGYVAIDDNGIRYENKIINFSGTLVNIALQCDEQYYCLASEVPSIDEPLF